MRDPYTVLGLPRDATDDMIKTAYRKLAMKYHPDQNQGDPSAEEKFKEIGAAYDKLKDPVKRAQDGAQQRASGRPFYDFEFNPVHGQSNFGDFDDFLNQWMRPPQSPPRRPQNADITVTCTLSLEEALSGKDVEISATTPSGSKRISVKVPPGVDNGSRLRVQGGGDRTYTNLPAGDLICTVQVLNHTRFRRVAQSLIVIESISVFDAILGGQIEIKTLDNQIVRVNVPAGLQPGQSLRIVGHGMPVLAADAEVRGDLLIEVKMVVPKSLTDEQRELITKAYTEA